MAKKNIPSVLSFEKKLAPSDGTFYGTTWDQRGNADAAFPICRPWVAKEPDRSGRPDLGKVLGKVGTVTTVVMQLGQGKLLYTKGSPVDTGDVYEELSL